MIMNTDNIGHDTHIRARSLFERFSRLTRSVLLFLSGMVALCATLSASAGGFFSDFNSGLPAGTTAYGHATAIANQGYTNSGCLMLTTNLADQNGLFVITTDLDAGAPVVGFTARFKVYVGPLAGTGADGFSFNFAPDLPAGTIFTEEEGVGTGLSVSFDSFSNDTVGGTDLAGIDVKVAGNQIATFPWAGLRPGTFVDVVIQLHPNGNLDVIYDGLHAYTNLNIVAYGFPASVTGHQFGLGARTGGSWDSHFFDNLSIATVTNGTAFVDSYSPIGRSVRADAPIVIELSDFNDPVTGNSQVDTSKITLTLDGAAVTPTVVNNPPSTTIQYAVPGLFASGSSHTVSLTYADSAAPIPNTNTWQWSFVVGTYTSLPGTLQAAPALVSANAGFDLRISQIDGDQAKSLQRAEDQLANLVLDPSTGLPYPNLATLTSYAESGTLNYSRDGGQGNFPTDASFPGLPGSQGATTNAALDAVAYLNLPVGLHTLGVNSSDGFRLTPASTPDVFAVYPGPAVPLNTALAPWISYFDTSRAAADTTLAFAVTNAGYYPFRVLYFNGTLTSPWPSTDTPSLEFFSVDANGTRTLINDATVTGFVPAFRPAQTLPYIRSVNPPINAVGVPGNTAIDAVLVDGSYTVQSGTIQVLVNSGAVSVTSSTVSGVTTVHYQPTAVFPAGSTNTIQIAFTDSNSTRRTNTWQFTVAAVLSEIWHINAGATTYVTTAGTERGLACNPKTGHVILASRNATAATQMAVLNGETGAFIANMNVTDISGGTFNLNNVDVAEDGVIYACNLVTGTGGAFKIYRWSDEASAPVAMTFTANGRWGDYFRVRGSGAGTQILTGTDNATVPIWTTTDGTNFTMTILSGSPTAFTASGSRTGQGFGCANAFYGKVNNQALSYITFNGPPTSAVGTLAAQYVLLTKSGASGGLSQIAVDIVNQRLSAIRSGSGFTHETDIYDLAGLVVSPANNNAIDTVNFNTSAGTFAVGQTDFNSEGTRLYSLDTGNGIKAFSLAPKLAAPTICGQPQTNIVAAIGSVGFFAVDSIGAPQNLYWRRNGTIIPGATRRTLDVHNVQQSDLGLYSVIISNSMGSVTSSVVILDTQMVITNQPADLLASVGGTATFTVGLTNGVAPYSYQWKFNGANVGANSSSYTVNDAQVANAGGYTVVVTDSLGQSVTSAQGSLTVGNVGNGTGLLGDYYSSQAKTFVNPPTLERLDPAVNFDWGIDSPDATISVDNFTVRWTGLVQPLYSQTYTFSTTTDDGARLWVNGQLLVDKWLDQGPTEWSGTIALTAYEKYPIMLEYYESGVGAVARLNWSSTGQVKQIIPQTQLYPATAPLQPTLSRSPDGTQLTMAWNGSYILTSATDVNGPWSVVATSSPYTVTIDPGTPALFFRLESQ